MADNSTIGVNLGGMITTTGAVNSQVLQSLADFIVAQHYTFETLSKANSTSVPDNVFVTLADDPVVWLSGASAGRNTGGFNATILGGGANTAIIAPGGNLSYSGAAGHVMAMGGTGAIVDTAAVASVTAIDGAYVVSATGSDTFILGGAAASVSAFSAGGSNAILEGGVTYSAGAADTISATAGTSTVIGAAGDIYSGGAASVLFFGAGTASTVIGGTGSDTVYGSGTTYVAGSGNNVYVGSQTASQVVGNTSGTMSVVGNGSGNIVLIGGAQTLIVGSGIDTIVGNGSSAFAPTIFGSNNSYELMVHAGKGALAIGLGDNTTLDGANSSNGLNYFANPGFGNQTFIGSETGADTFYIGAQNIGQSLVSIRNWHSGDSLNLSAFGAADQANAASVLTRGGNLFKLSDGTTVVFDGNHPTHANGGAFS